MKHLLDVNVVIAGTVTSHPRHTLVSAWLAGKSVVLCPLSELGFLRITTHPRIGLSMADARKSLQNFATFTGAERIPADLPALDSYPRTSSQVTDHYLADLAVKHNLKLATLDADL